MNNKPSDLDAFLQLPTDPKKSEQIRNYPEGDKSGEKLQNPAAELIRQKVEAAYSSEPGAAAEVQEVATEPANTKRTKHQKFIYDLTGSGKSLAEIQMAWHDYYAGLPDAEKHSVWQEFYAAQAAESHYPLASAAVSPAPSTAKAASAQYPNPLENVWRKFAGLKSYAAGVIPAQPKARKPVSSLVFGLSVGAAVIVIFLFSFFNERFIAPFIQPSRSLSNVPLITDNSAVGPNPEVIIPKINVEIPVVYGVSTIDEASVDNALESGVVHYADTALPGQNGNVVIVGHSSNNIFNKGKYKFAFVLLSRMEPGDTFYLQKDGKRYTYQIYQKKIVKPTDTSVLGITDKPATATLITCDPPGTSINRLVVTAEQINPDPSSNTAEDTSNSLATKAKIVPGNSQSLWSRFWKSL